MTAPHLFDFYQKSVQKPLDASSMVTQSDLQMSFDEYLKSRRMSQIPTHSYRDILVRCDFLNHYHSQPGTFTPISVKLIMHKQMEH